MVGAPAVPARNEVGRRIWPPWGDGEGLGGKRAARERRRGKLGRRAGRADQPLAVVEKAHGLEGAEGAESPAKRLTGRMDNEAGRERGHPLACRVVVEGILSDLTRRAGQAQAEVGALSLDERLARLEAGRESLAARGPQIVREAVREVGQPLRFARRELQAALGLLDALAELAWAIRPRAVTAVRGTTALEWAPYGVVLGWHAANSPVWVPTLVGASALCGGNAVLSRPSSRTRATTTLALSCLAAHFPSDAVLVCDLPGPAAEPLVWHPGVHAVVTHGSTDTCKRQLAGLGAAYARGARLRPYIPEGSGNDALIILPGADLERAAEAAALGGFANAGQLCMSAKRMIVERSVWPALAPLLRRAVGGLVLGDPEDERTDVAPFPEGPARDLARRALAEALELGGVVVVGEGERGPYLTPTVVLLPRDAARHALLWREESFAPFRGLVLADGPADALALANDTPYGLGAAVFGAPALVAGIVPALGAARIVVGEDPLYQDPHLVVGGIGDSGLGGARPKLEQLVFARRVHRAGS